MEERLIKLVYDYSVNYVLADRDFYHRALDILCCYYDITEYLYYPIIYTENINSYGMKTLRINENYATSMYKKLDMYNESNRILIANMKSLTVLLHEFGHIIQEKRYDYYNKNNVDNIERQLIGICRAFRSIKRKDSEGEYSIYEKYHNSYPVERMANIKANKYMHYLTTLETSFNGAAENYFKENYYKYILQGYKLDSKNDEQNIYPLEDFLDKIQAQYLLNQFSFYDENKINLIKNVDKKYSLDQKVLYGLPLVQGEISKVYKKSF